jgi:hypothetical protein
MLFGITRLAAQVTTEAFAAAALMATVAAATMCFSKRFEIRIVLISEIRVKLMPACGNLQAGNKAQIRVRKWEHSALTEHHASGTVLTKQLVNAF